MTKYPRNAHHRKIDFNRCKLKAFFFFNQFRKTDADQKRIQAQIIE